MSFSNGSFSNGSFSNNSFSNGTPPSSTPVQQPQSILPRINDYITNLIDHNVAEEDWQDERCAICQHEFGSEDGTSSISHGALQASIPRNLHTKLPPDYGTQPQPVSVVPR